MQDMVRQMNGAESSNGTTEAKINLSITYKTKELLEQNGYKVILTRSDDNAINDSSATTIKEMKRSDIKNSKANIGDGKHFIKKEMNKEKN